MREIDKRTALGRRSVLRGAAVAPGAAALAAAGTSLPDAAWASDAKTLDQATMATLLRAARDIFPHDHIADRFYIAAVAPYDAAATAAPALKTLLVEGCATLDREAQARFRRPYRAVVAEAQRVTVLKAIETTPFFAKLRGDLVVSLYNQKAIWAKFGYEGSSHEHGGYLERGFDDIDWLGEA